MRSRSPFETVPELLTVRAADRADAPAVVFEGRAISYGELEDATARVHGWLLDAGVAPGQTVALLLRNSPEFLYAWLGIIRSGAICVPVNTAMVGDGLRYVLEHSDSVGLIADADLLAEVDAVGTLPALRWRVAVGDAPGAEPFRALTEHAPPAARPDLHGGSPATIVYTSGTTGMPKGVVLPQLSFCNTGAYFAHHMGFTPEDRLHTCLPLFHCNAQQCTFMPAFHLGIPVALDVRFSVSRFWPRIRDAHATATNLLGAMLALLAKVPEAPQDADNPLRRIIAAPVPETLYRPFERRFGLRIVEGYGLTETGTMAAINPVAAVQPGTFGLPLEHNEVRIVDEHDEPVADGVAGEIVTRTHIEHVHARVLQGAGEDGGGDARRLVSHRRPRHAARRRVLRVPRPAQGHDPPPRREHLVVPRREGRGRASRGAPVRGGRRAVGAQRGGREGRRGPA